jgi:GH25 family lysozyme M1 (1,4-beta-N-acetylmuramidase)
MAKLKLPAGYYFNDRLDRLADFEQPLPLANRIRALLSAAPNCIMGIDPNRFSYTNIVDPKAAYAAGYRFAIVETAWGLWKPPSFDEIWPKLLDAGFLLFGYGFFRGDQPGSAQADFLLETVAPMYEAQKFWMPLFSDVEPFTGDASTIANRAINWRAWVKEIRLADVQPGVYSSQLYWQKLMANEPLPDDVLEWVAHYTSYTTPLMPPGWDLKFHQIGIATKYSWCPAIPGINGAMDVNRFYGTEFDLEAMKSHETPLPPPPVDLQPILDRLDALEARVDILENPLPPPPPVTPPAQTWARVRVTRDPGANAFHALTNNANGFPIMVAYTPQIQFALDRVLDVYPDKVDADGSIDFWKLAPAHVPANAPALYLRADNVVKV